MKDATSYRHGVRPIEKTLSRITNGISEISFAFLNIIPVGKIIEDINVSISFENVSRIDFEKSFSHHVVNHKTNMVLTDLTERIHIYLNSSEQYLLINDLCELKCSNMTYCLTLNLTCRIQSEDMDTSSMSAILSTSWTGTHLLIKPPFVNVVYYTIICHKFQAYILFIYESEFNFIAIINSLLKNIILYMNTIYIQY